MGYIDDSIALLRSPSFEGSVSWMYLDSRGNVTCAVGQLLATAADACSLPFHLDGMPASYADIIDDWKRVKAMAPGHSPSYYHSDSSPILSGPDIANLLRSRVVGFDSQLAKRFAGWDDFPEEVKLALLDMEFNLGDGGEAKYTHMNASVVAEDWAAASTQCYRHGPDAERNIWCENQFRKAAGLAPKGAA
jgi:hypothetical protein